jgi:hypothetical protein
MNSEKDTPPSKDCFYEREIRKEIRKKEAKMSKVNDEIRSVVYDLGFYEEENRKLEKVEWLEQVLFELITKIRNEISFGVHCQKTYALVTRLADKQHLVTSITRDMLKRSNWSVYDLFGRKCYQIAIEDKSRMIDESEKIESFVVSLAKTEVVERCDETKSNGCSNSTDDDVTVGVKVQPASTREKEKNDKKGFKPKNSFRWNTGDETFNLEINDSLFEKKLGKAIFRLPTRQLIAMKAKVSEFFCSHTISDSLRKEMWKTRIGNKLRITKPYFNSLVDRLSNESISKKAEKTIIDDLDRTFPECSGYDEGRKMYQDMRLVLSLFEVDTSSGSSTGQTSGMCKE